MRHPNPESLAATFALLLILGCTPAGTTVDPEQEQRALTAYRKGQRLLQEGKAEEAIRELTAAVEGSKGFHQALAVRGAAYESLGRREEALRDLGRAIEVSRDDEKAPYHFNRARMLQRFGRLSEAETDFNAVIDRQKEWPDPDHLVDYYLGRALFLLQIKKVDGCIQDCRYVLSLNPDAHTRAQAEQLIREAQAGR